MNALRKNRMVSNTVMLYIMTIGKYLLPLITLPYLTRILTPSYYGVVSYMSSTMIYFQVLIDYGFNYSATRDVSLYRDDKEYVGSVLSAVIKARLLLALVGAVVLSVIIPFVPILKENIPLTYLYYISVAITCFLPDYVYRGLEKMQIVSMRFIISRLVSTALTFVFVRSKNDILWVPILTIAGNCSAVVFSFTHLYRKERIRLCKTRLKDALSSLKKSSPFFIATFSTTAYGTTTTFLMGVARLPVEQIAYWSVAYHLISSIQMLYDPIISSIYPYMVKNKDYRLIKKVLLLIMPIIAIGVTACYFGAALGIRIFSGEGYSASVPLFRTLLPILVLSFPAQLLGFPVLASMNKEKLATLSNVISAIFHVSGLLTLIIIGEFSLMNIAILRCCTDGVLFISRVLIFYIVNKPKKA